MHASMISARTVRLLALVGLGMLLSGCALGNTANVTLTRTTTIGQELIDLKSALDSGAMTNDEYQRAKVDIMRQASWADYTKTGKKSK